MAFPDGKRFDVDEPLMLENITPGEPPIPVIYRGGDSRTSTVFFPSTWGQITVDNGRLSRPAPQGTGQATEETQ